MTRDPGRPEDGLEAYFAAARAEAPVPSVALMSTILGDAADISAARLPVEVAAPAAASPRRWGGLRTVLDLLGGWRGAAVLGTCAALGFWIGLVGSGDLSGDLTGGTFQADSAASESVADPVAAFYDLALAEG